jgi:hypothetical protein
MEPIPVFFDLVHRSALSVIPKRPFIDWLKSIDDDDYSDLFNDTDLYLIPDFEEESQIEKWLIKNYDMIFCDQMNHWYTDEDIWVKDRTFKLFKQWFDYSVFTMVWDTLEGPIKK